jgi:serine/threonine protein kinase
MRVCLLATALAALVWSANARAQAPDPNQAPAAEAPGPTVPFGGSTPLAIAMKHSNEAPRRPSEFVPSIPPALEDVVLHALEKKPEDRPPNAEAFRQELLETTERLGLEHASTTSAPSIEALRNAGTESPSGRLVIDLGRLRENRASTSGASELTVVAKNHDRRQPETNTAAQNVVVTQQQAVAPQALARQCQR